MGMAASQARYLSLVNQLNDVEFEGQQINTARTQLSSTSAKYYNQLLAMDVPTPPVKSDFTTLTYRYSSGANDYTITHIGNIDAEGNAQIKTQHTGYGATVQKSIATGENEATIAVECKKEKTGKKDENGKDIEEDVFYIGGQKAQGIDSLDEAERESLEKAIKQSGQNPDNYYVFKDAKGQIKLALKSEVESPDVKAKGKGAAQLYEIHDSKNALYEEEKNVKLEFGTDGRISKIIEGGIPILVEPILTVDEFAYEDAFAQYTYEKNIYDKDQAAVNAQLSTIQQQDKRLELQLTELDTRRTQITTELEAVKGVLGDNVDRTYKTFSG